jgi:hypothetical protein
MVLNGLLERLHVLLGAPKTLSDPQSQLWTIVAPKGRFEICLTFEEMTDRASIWIHNVASGGSETYAFELARAGQVDTLLALIVQTTGVGSV